MNYQRKTKDVYLLIWNNEEIDQFDSRKEACEMRKEYMLAFNGSVFIRATRQKL